MKKIFLFLIIIGLNKSFSQNVCENSSEGQNDLNVITSRKCLIPRSGDSDKSPTRTLRPKRYLTVRNVKSYGVAKLDENVVKSITPSLSLIKESEDLDSKIFTFSEVDVIPSFKKCKGVSTPNKRKTCYNIEIKKHIYDNIVYPEIAIENYLSGIIDVRFNINKKGKVKEVVVIGKEELKPIKNEVKRLIYNLPKFIPATKNGTNVSTSFNLSLNFFY